jgi:hypothetical protein
MQYVWLIRGDDCGYSDWAQAIMASNPPIEKDPLESSVGDFRCRMYAGRTRRRRGRHSGTGGVEGATIRNPCAYQAFGWLRDTSTHALYPEPRGIAEVRTATGGSHFVKDHRVGPTHLDIIRELNVASGLAATNADILKRNFDQPNHLVLWIRLDGFGQCVVDSVQQFSFSISNPTALTSTNMSGIRNAPAGSKLKAAEPANTSTIIVLDSLKARNDGYNEEYTTGAFVRT